MSMTTTSPEEVEEISRKNIRSDISYFLVKILKKVESGDLVIEFTFYGKYEGFEYKKYSSRQMRDKPERVLIEAISRGILMETREECPEVLYFMVDIDNVSDVFNYLEEL